MMSVPGTGSAGPAPSNCASNLCIDIAAVGGIVRVLHISGPIVLRCGMHHSTPWFSFFGAWYSELSTCSEELIDPTRSAHITPPMAPLVGLLVAPAALRRRPPRCEVRFVIIDPTRGTGQEFGQASITTFRPNRCHLRNGRIVLHCDPGHRQRLSRKRRPQSVARERRASAFWFAGGFGVGWVGVDTDPGYYSNNLKSLSTARDNSSASRTPAFAKCDILAATISVGK
jgi:hypothetical protein